MNTKETMSLGRRIKSARHTAGLTQEELAALTLTSRSHIAAIEVDAYNPSLITLQRIAEVLKVPVGSLIDDSAILNTLNKRQIMILRGFNSLNAEYQNKLLGYLDCLLQNMNTKK